MDAIKKNLQTLFTFRWKPGRDLVVVLLSCVLVTASLYTAMHIVTPDVGGGMPYFFIYAGLTACVFGVGLPLFWMTIHHKRPIHDLGITRKNIWISLILQLIFSVLLYTVTLAKTELPPLESLLPLVAMTLAIGFFEAFFWRGWVLLRLEESFGYLPAVILGSALYAVYHIGYGMPLDEMLFLFWIGILFAVCFRLTSNLLILWPIFQPMGQLVTLIEDGLSLPLLASVGFIEALVLMFVMVWLANRYYRKNQAQVNLPVPAG